MTKEKQQEPHYSKYYEIKSIPKAGAIHTIYINNDIVYPFEYHYLLNFLRSTTVDDEVHLYINSDGGSVDTTLQIINAMRECPAIITAVIDGCAHSAASMIFLAADGYMITPCASMLCHYFTGGSWGKGNEIVEHVNFREKHFKKLFSEIYKDFLTTVELQEMFKGTDFWFDAKEIERRLKNREKANEPAPKIKTKNTKK